MHKYFYRFLLILSFTTNVYALPSCADVETIKLTSKKQTALEHVIAQQSSTQQTESSIQHLQWKLKAYVDPIILRSHGWTVLSTSQYFYDPKTGDHNDASDGGVILFSSDPLHGHSVGVLGTDPYSYEQMIQRFPNMPKALARCLSDPNLKGLDATIN